MSNVFVLSFTHLKDKPHGDRALHILKRVASLVKPIMRSHNWKLPVLAEFFPEQANLLGININAGQKICLRLRLAHDPGRFLDETEIVQTMLHELTHNVHGPHNEAFYKFLSKLQDEYDDLQRSGYAGEGFFSEGKRLGVGVSHNLSPQQARAKALAAAEKRAQTARVLGHGGRLGGIDTKGLSPRELAAQAAERRARDENACGSGAVAEREAAKAAENSIENKVIDLTGSDSDESDVVEIVDERKVTATSRAVPKQLGRKSSLTTRTAPLATGPVSLAAPVTSGGSSKPSRITPLEPWACSFCTLINEALAFKCDACLSPKPVEPQSQDGWTCLECGERGMPDNWWSCRFCGTTKASS